jgi:hypothetical protein
MDTKRNDTLMFRPMEDNTPGFDGGQNQKSKGK